MPRLAERPSGGVTTVIVEEEALVWLHGDIDLSLRPVLGDLAARLAADPRRVVVDTAGLTFCDATLAGFLVEILDRVPVSVVAPSRRVREFLVLYGLADRLTLVH